MERRPERQETDSIAADTPALSKPAPGGRRPDAYETLTERVSMPKRHYLA